MKKIKWDTEELPEFLHLDSLKSNTIYYPLLLTLIVDLEGWKKPILYPEVNFRH